jgi:hypothetical protein
MESGESCLRKLEKEAKRAEKWMRAAEMWREKAITAMSRVKELQERLDKDRHDEPFKPFEPRWPFDMY